MRLIDIHAHMNFDAYDSDRDEVIERALDDGICMINVGTQIENSLSAIQLAEKYDTGVYAIVGLHPIYAASGEKFDVSPYRKMLSNPKVVGVGECGLDFFRLETDTKKLQVDAFAAQIALANEFGKSLMLHIRDAYDDALDLLKSHAKVKGNAHFFAGTVDQARKFLDLGYTLSFTGVITFARQYEELVKFVPLDMIQAETDCPFVTPVPYRGKRNEPGYVCYVVDKIARIKKLPLEEVESALMDNARRVWGLQL